MNPKKPFSVSGLTKGLIQIPSVGPAEQAATEYVFQLLSTLPGHVERFPVDSTGRENLLFTVGNPEVLLSTHLDVVPALPVQFLPEERDGKIFGRGACDAKGIAASMICAAKELIDQGVKNFGLLFVVGEETAGDGAKAAAVQLQGRGIHYFINGEPTEGKLATAHKGALLLSLKTRGRSAHSGYPELGESATEKLIDVLQLLRGCSFGSDPILGEATLNIAQLVGGKATNVIPASAEAVVSIRTVLSQEQTLSMLTEVLQDRCTIDTIYSMPRMFLKTVPGFETAAMKYGTDIPHFQPLGATFLMYGPGTIQVAHTDNEFIAISDLEQAVKDYVTLVHRCKQNHT